MSNIQKRASNKSIYIVQMSINAQTIEKTIEKQRNNLNIDSLSSYIKHYSNFNYLNDL